MPIEENINKSGRKLRVLLAPLDWGLGHATRCIPIIHALNSEGVEVLVAGETGVAKIVEKTLVPVVILPLKGYRVNYSKSRKFFLLKMFWQLPKIMLAIRHENRWLKKVVREYEIDAIISDNRFGFYHKEIPSVFITHQLSIQTGNHFFDKLAQKINYRYVEHFNECWAPDMPGADNLAGILSHPTSLPNIPVKYLGMLSRFKKKQVEKNNDLLILLSGPEPQRSIFEEMLLAQLKDFAGITVLVRGLPVGGKDISSHSNNKFTIHNHLNESDLSDLIQRSTEIVARCGYSTIMDLTALQRKAILVPTPGQTEQEYLSEYLMKRKLFFTCPQEGFSLINVLHAARHFEFAPANEIPSIHEAVIKDWVAGLKSRLTTSK